MSANKPIRGKMRVRDLIRQVLQTGGEDAGYEYLITSFLSTAILALLNARRSAHLSQEEIAKHLKTKQPAIARIEADLSGAIRLDRYVRYAQACGLVPLDITLVPLNKLRGYVLANPDAPRTADAYATWLFQQAQAAGNTDPKLKAVEAVPNTDPKLKAITRNTARQALTLQNELPTAAEYPDTRALTSQRPTWGNAAPTTQQSVGVLIP